MDLNYELYLESQNRNIEYLIHFTKMDNLTSIMQNGILPNDIQRKMHINGKLNDDQRLDHTDAVCLSVSFPNYKLFYRFRERYEQDHWVVLLLDPRLLLINTCKFAYKNAASSEIMRAPAGSLEGILAFQRMFSETKDWRTREQMQTATNETTDPQAEILVFDAISPGFISKIVVRDHADAVIARQMIPANEVGKVVENLEMPYFSAERGRYVSYFDSRPDYRYWRY